MKKGVQIIILNIILIFCIFFSGISNAGANFESIGRTFNYLFDLVREVGNLRDVYSSNLARKYVEEVELGWKIGNRWYRFNDPIINGNPRVVALANEALTQVPQGFLRGCDGLDSRGGEYDGRIAGPNPIRGVVPKSFNMFNGLDATGKQKFKRVYCQTYDFGAPYTTYTNLNIRPGGQWRNEQIIFQASAKDVGGIGFNNFSGAGKKYRWESTHGTERLSDGNGNCRFDSAGAGTGMGINDTLYSGNSGGRIREGIIYINFCNQDKAGNTRDQQKYGPWKIDLRAPARPSNWTNGNSHPRGVPVSDNTLTFTVGLNDTGNNGTTGPSPITSSYCIDTNNSCTPGVNGILDDSRTNGEFNTNNRTFPLNLPDNNYYFRSHVSDTGGTSEIDSYNFIIDTTPPEALINGQDIDLVGPLGTGGWTNRSEDVIIRLNSIRDITSDVQFSRTRWERSQNMSACVTGTDYGGTNITTTIPSQGEYYHAVCIRDDAGNDREHYSAVYQYDNTIPSSPTIRSSHVRDAWNTTSNVSFDIQENNLFSYSNTTGTVGPSPHETRYCIKKGSPCSPTEVNNGTIGTNYTADLDDGIWYFSARTLEPELPGHESPIETYMIQIDTELPIHEANPPHRLDWSNVSTLNISLTSSDPLKDGSNSGILRSRYIVNQNANSPFDATCNGGTNVPDTYTDFAEGTNYIHMCTIDNAGNRNISTTNTFGYYLVDLTDPEVVDNYTANSGVWQNTDQTITLTATDAHSGINILRYCLGAGCTPNINLISANTLPVGTNTVTRNIPIFRANAPTDTIVRYQTIDYATRESAITQIDVKTENYNPTAPIPIYHNGRDNNTIPSQRNILYSANDTGGSGLEIVTLERRVATTNNNGGHGAFGAWEIAETNTNLNGDTFSSVYSQDFENGRAMQFRVLYSDEAGNIGITQTSTNTLMMDDVLPTVSDNYGNNGIWVNTNQIINFTLFDNDSGIPNNITGRRYCIGAIGNTCTPNIFLPDFLSFGPDTEQTLRYNVTDRATNDSIPEASSIDILIEDNLPTGTLNYRDGWDNSPTGDNNTLGQSIANRTIRYSAEDTAGGINSNLKIVTLQRGICPVSGACSPNTWEDVPGHTNNINQPTLARTYVQPFEDERSYQYRLYVEDWAGNVVAPTGYVLSTNILRMDNQDPDINIGYTGVSSTWYNINQTINFPRSDNYAGVRSAMYCEVAVGLTCDPLIGSPAPASKTYPPDTELSVYFQADDFASNESEIQRIDVLIEDNYGTAAVGYFDEWVNVSTNIGYRGSDIIEPNSNIRTLALQRREADITANNGDIGAFGIWDNVPGNVYNFSSGNPERSNRSVFDTINYIQPFTNRKAYQYRTYIEDVAGNKKWVYERPDGSGVPIIDNDTAPGGEIATLKMEDEESNANFTNLDTNLSPNGWTNVPSQSIRIELTDTGGSGLANYVLEMLDVSDSPFFNDLNTANDSDWSQVDSGTITGENRTITYNFTGVNNHAYDFRIRIIDDAENDTGWIRSTETPIKIDTVDPVASDVSDVTAGSPLLATNQHNFIYSVDRNLGAPILEVIGSFENWNSPNNFLATNDDSRTDRNGSISGQIDVQHSIQNVDNDRVDPGGYREYTYRIIRIRDEAGNIREQLNGNGIINFDYQVYANTNVTNIATETLNGISNVDNTSNIADGSVDTLTARLADIYGNAIVKATAIGREINFSITPRSGSNIWLNQYERNGGQAIFMETSQSSGFQPIDEFASNLNYLSDLVHESGRDGEYDFNFQVYAPTASWYPNSNSVSDPGANFNIENFQYGIIHNSSYSSWDALGQSLDNGQNIDFKYGPLFSTGIEGDIEDFGFIEGANQASRIRIQKGASSANPNAKSLWLEFGISDQLPSPLLSLETFSPNMQIGEGNPDATNYSNFSLIPANSTTSLSIDSLLNMERGTTLDEIQNSYLSTHVSYTLDGHDIMYNSDIMGKDNYFGNQTGDNTVQAGIKILGQTHSSRQRDIIQSQGQNDIQLLGNIYKASLKRDIVKNAFTIIRNSNTNNFGNTTINNLVNLTSNSGGDKLFNNSIIFYGNDGTNGRVDLNLTNNRVSGKKTILTYGRNIYIESNMYYMDKNSDILGIISLTDEDGNGGNIYIDPSVTNIVGTLFAEKSLISYDGNSELGGGTDQELLKNQLHIYGSIFSENTIGGSRSNPIICPYYIDTSNCNQDTAQIYDMNYLRRYFTYMNAGVKVPANNAKVIGGGTCNNFGICSVENINFNRIISNSDTSTFSKYPVMIEYNSSAQTNPAPLFESSQ